MLERSSTEGTSRVCRKMVRTRAFVGDAYYRFGPRLVWARCTHVLASVLARLNALGVVLCVRALACGRVYAVWVLGAS